MEFTIQHERKLDKLGVDVWEGEGKDNPSITARLAVLEDALDKLSANIGKLVWLVISTVLAVIADIVFHSIKL